MSQLLEWDVCLLEARSCAGRNIPLVWHVTLCYTMVCAHVRCDNARAWASALSHVYAQNHGITDLSHLHACRPSTSRDISCWKLGILATMPIVVVVWIFNATRHPRHMEAAVFVQPCFHVSPMHTWFRCLSPSATLSTLYSTQGTSIMS